MSVFNRSFVSMLALAYGAVLAVGAWLVWDQSRDIHLNSNNIKLNFDLVFNSQAEQILATIIIAALALPALMLLAMEMTPSVRNQPKGDRRRDQDYGAMQAKLDSMQKQLDAERSGRRDAEKDLGRERDLGTREARRNADVVRDSAAARPAVVTNRDTREVRDSRDARDIRTTDDSRRRGWHLLPRRS